MARGDAWGLSKLLESPEQDEQQILLRREM